MRSIIEKDYGGFLLRIFGANYQGEIAYARVGLSGLMGVIEFPSDWHDYRRAWVRIGLGFITLAFSFPWSKVVPDQGQCSGPEYGFKFHSDMLWIYFGKSTGCSKDSRKYLAINMPWQWRHAGTETAEPAEQHNYHYVLRNWEVQRRIATIQAEKTKWIRYWIPWVKKSRYIKVDFDGEVGERTGSWKGGCTGCGYEIRRKETPVECLRRMERERKF